MCPSFDILDEILGGSVNIEPPYLFESTSAEDELNFNSYTEYENLEEGDVNEDIVIVEPIDIEEVNINNKDFEIICILILFYRILQGKVAHYLCR